MRWLRLRNDTFAGRWQASAAVHTVSTQRQRILLEQPTRLQCGFGRSFAARSSLQHSPPSRSA
eukprot:16196-Heterococcus_DN1.PRE.1